MKGQTLYICILLATLIKQAIQGCGSGPNMPIGFVQISDSQAFLCIKCDTTCKTCSGININNCVTCPTDFTFDDSLFYCYQPQSSTIHTIQSSYKFYLFQPLSTWTGTGGISLSSTPSTYPMTVLYGSDKLITTFNLQPHYKLRVLASLWWLDVTAYSGDISLTVDALPPAIIFSKPDQLTNNKTLYYVSNTATTNIDKSFVTTDQSSATVTFQSTGDTSHWGIREFIFIQYLCYSVKCASCTGPAWNECISCTDSNRVIYGSTKQCRCDSDQHYYKHPSSDYCVNPCPSFLAVQYYGDKVTKDCVATCPDYAANTNWGILFADDVSGQCVETCPLTIDLDGVTRKLYHDVTNRRCVVVCPDTQPYSYQPNRTCYANCPASGYFKLNSSMSCVDPCPTNIPIPLYGDINTGFCQQQCIYDWDWWADPIKKICTDDCSADKTVDYFQDNSTGRNLCVDLCPQPQWFGDSTVSANNTGWRCVTKCPTGYFGDTVSGSSRHCVSRCNGSYFGLLTGNRACVQICPQGTWGQTDTYTCLLTPAACGAKGLFADNFTRMCVAGGTCSLGLFSRNDTKTCQQFCPDGTYANQVTHYCQSACDPPYFADPGINWCVQKCFTQNLYADVSSGRKCVASCNQSGLTTYRDFYTKTCVNQCPTNPDLYADPVQDSCVYNCTPSYYADSSTANHTCVSICPSNYFADNSTGYGLCILVCPDDPPLFGDVVGSDRICVAVCQSGKFGDQTGTRRCTPTCPDGWFAQNDSLRRCVRVCNQTTYGYNKVCYFASQFATNLPSNYVGDPYTNLAVTLCPISQGTFADPISRQCVQLCPIDGTTRYYADPTDRWCKTTCDATNLLFGNNDTRTCEKKCLDTDAYADAQHPNRFCIQWCTDVGTAPAITYYYRNNYTKVCVVSNGCPTDYFADNSTQTCVAKCPIINTIQTWGMTSTQTCVATCHNSLFGDASTGIALCIVKCPSVPAKWAYDGNWTCMQVCPTSPQLFGQDFNRTCVLNCPKPPLTAYQTYAYDGTRRCLKDCPQGTFADYINGICYHYPQNCSGLRWGDDYNNSCTYLCTGPTPWDTFGDNQTSLCTILCSEGSYADNYTGTRMCVETCPGSYAIDGTPVTGSHDSFGDNNTWRCVSHCLTPGTWADWQTHRCQIRCTGDISSDIPTYSQNVNYRCVIALACPKLPDKLFGDNNTRACVTYCLYNDDTDLEWADNITRTCLPQCLNTSITRFFGDTSTGHPICVIACPQSPRLFGQNTTNRCVQECPDHQYGDQTGNRSCVAICPVINSVMWFSQITQRICVLVCEQTTYGNVHNSHCQTVPTDCPVGQYGDNSTNLCVTPCPQSMNYFGDPSTKLCVDRCPTLTSTVVNVTAGINLAIGHLFADYSTRLCVYTCPATVGLHGTFGDTTTNTCVQRCPNGYWGDSQHSFRHCVLNCTSGSFADNLTNRCVSVCPSSPPYFGQTTDWTCVKQCPSNTWADASTRRCVPTCPSNQFRLTSFRNQCVNICPSDPDLYGDTHTYHCVSSCSNNQFADPTDRMCKTSCLPLSQYNYRCVQSCPDGYYANALGNCVLPTACDTGTYGDNVTTKCVSPCTGGSFADPNSRFCIAICPSNWYGDVNVCVQTCTTVGASISKITNQCQSNCPNFTYHESGQCVAKCVIGYANDVSKTCATSCPAGQYTDPVSHDCVATCTGGYFKDTVLNKCTNDCSPKFKDFITNQCVAKCSGGYWGHTGNYTCLQSCTSGQYGYEDSTKRTCYTPSALPASAGILFGDPESGQFISVCQTAPDQYFGDRNRKLCVKVCQPFSSTDYYGDPSTRQCESSCKAPSFYTADPAISQCVLRCTLGTYRWNNSLTAPICVDPCPQGYADPSTRICVAVCPIQADTFGFYNTTSLDRICLQQCPDDFYAQPIDRTCTSLCPNTFFGLNLTNQCVKQCLNSFADKSKNLCMDACHSLTYPNADNSTNQCVATCPSVPDYFSDNHICVFYCTTPGYYADPSTRKCVPRCPNITAYYTYGNPLTGRCVQNCSLGYYGDNSTNLCVSTCPSGSFADNQTRKCVQDCPKDQNIYGDTFEHKCAYTCSKGYFGSQITQQCVEECQTNYWGDPLTTLCVSQCPVKIYSYGQNKSRTCVTSCVGFQGYADNYSRLCRDKCQNTTTPQTFADPTTMFCVQICPYGYYAQNDSQACVPKCPNGYADNYSQYCVSVCPDDPETYGDTHDNTCVFQCISGQFSENISNLCVGKCPTTPDYYGDPNNGRCVFFCTQGTYAQNDSRLCQQKCPNGQFADNLTRRCVKDCPVSQGTFADSTTNRCVRICPEGYYAENDTQTCQSGCKTYSNGSFGYADNITKHCVAVCPYPFFGHNTSHKCVKQCPQSSNQYGHYVGRVCVSASDCFLPLTGQIFYSDYTTRTCVQVCPQTLWADTSTKKCVDPCPSGQYRNLHTQMCVSLCPTDPDQYADDISKNCVRTCPPDSYAYSDSGNTIRKCISLCSSYSLYQDNITNRCVSVCPTKPFMYSDINVGKCVFHCSNGWFADNKTQTCVQTCPSDWQLFGQRHQYTCVNHCPPNQYADINKNRQCVLTCTSGTFADKYTSTCVDHCFKIKPYYYQYLSSCFDVCPIGSVGYNPNQTCLTPIGSCPGLYFADKTSKLCVLICPNGTYATNSTKTCQQTCSGSQYADQQSSACVTTCSENTFALIDLIDGNKCVQFCPDPYFAQNSTKSCVKQCSVLLALQTTRSCQTYCPQPYFADQDNNKCVLNCTPYFADSVSRKCLSSCSPPAYNDPLKMECTLLCPEGYFGRNNSRDCQKTCQAGSYADPSIRICVGVCPDYPLLFAYDGTWQCLPKCISPTFGFIGNRTCLNSCPNISTQIYLADTFTRQCVLECVQQPLTYADYQNNQCTYVCPSGKFASNLTKQCVPVCPSNPNDTFADNNSKICVQQCYNGFGSSTLLLCVIDCQLPYYADPTTRLCVDFCPDGYFAQDSSAKCVQKCPTNQYADSTTHRCVSTCPAVADLFKLDIGWLCVAQCPEGFYADQNTRKCQTICDSTSNLYAYDLTNQCLRQCPFPYRGYDVNHTCILTCPVGYFYNKTRNICSICADNCLECTGLQACKKCANSFNLFNGLCNTSCIPTDIITYADPFSSACVQVCPGGYFGDNSTYACKDKCPAKQYGSNATRLCQYCPETCDLCNSSTFCSQCISGATLAIDNMCYTDCSSTQKYYLPNNTCAASCPDGTYVTFTNVHCSECSVLCKTCSINSTNCNSCIGRYFYNNTCLTKCPQGFYGSSDFVCQLCSANPSACQKPLEFKTNVYVQNYKYVINMTFNQDVDIKKEIQKILRVKLQLQRRLLGIQELINNGVPFTYEILSDGTIKITLQLTDSLSNPVFVVQVIDPTAIVSKATGGSLQNVNYIIEIAQVEYYPQQQAQRAPVVTASLFAIVFLLVLYFMSFLFTDTIVRPLQICQLLAFHAVINISMPASQYYFLLNLKHSLLQFLPNLLSIPIGQQPINLSSPLRVKDAFIDFNFLRNTGQILFLVILFIPFMLVFLLLGNNKLMPNKNWRRFFFDISTHRFRIMVINDIVSIMYLPVLWFGFMQMNELFQYGGYQGFNSFLCLVTTGIFLIIPFIWLIIWIKNRGQPLLENYWFLGHRIKTDPQRAQLQKIIRYWHLTFCAIWLTALYQYPSAQMFMLIITHTIYLLFQIVVRPDLNCINTLITIVCILTVIIVEAFNLHIIFNPQLTSYAKTYAASSVLFTVSAVLILIVLWACWRCVWQIMYLYYAFKNTDVYKIYGDPQVQVSQTKSEVYQKIQKQVVNNIQMPGDIIIDKITKQVTPQGKNIIKVRKRVLKKKKKRQIKKPQVKIENEEDEQQFIRINKQNPFDYKEQQPKLKEQKKVIVQKRHFDDDLHDILSDDDTYQPKRKKTEEQKMIDLEQDDRMVYGVQDLENQNQVFDKQQNNSDRNHSQEQKTQNIAIYDDEILDQDKDEQEYYDNKLERRQNSNQHEDQVRIQQQSIKKEEQPIKNNKQEDPFDYLIDEQQQKKPDDSQLGSIKAKVQDSQEKEQIGKSQLDELLDQQQNKKKKLMFLFDDLDENDL